MMVAAPQLSTISRQQSSDHGGRPMGCEAPYSGKRWGPICPAQ